MSVNMNIQIYDPLPDQSTTNYWEQSSSTETTSVKPRRKKVTFDDILTNMNLVINEQGMLQHMVTTSTLPPAQPYSAGPIPEAVKHSTIYNKYSKRFNQYQDPYGPPPEAPQPMTRAQILNQLAQQQQQRAKIAETKSTRLQFTNIPNNVINSTKHQLRRMSFF